MKYSLQKRISAFVLAFALVMTTAFNSVGVTTANAAALKCKSLSANKSSVSVVEGSSVKVTVTQKFNKKSAAKISVTSSDKSVATVSKKLGKKAKSAKATLTIKGVAAGTATITVKSTKKTKKTKKITVTVKAKETATTAAPATTQASADATTGTVVTTEAPASANASDNALKKVSLSTTNPKVGDVITVVLEPTTANDVKSYTWYEDDVAVSGNATSSYTVTEKSVGKKIRVTVTNNAGTKFESNSTAPVVVDNSKSVTITNLDGFQADGTALNTDDLSLIFGDSLGLPKTITWYVNNSLVKSFNSAASPITDQAIGYQGYSTAPTGSCYAKVVTEDGTYTTPTITIVKTPVVATLSSVKISEDYATPAIDMAKETNNFVVSVTLNKDYDGKFFLVETGAKEITTTTCGTGYATASANAKTDSKDMTEKAALAAGLKRTLETKEVQYMFKAPKALTRGKEYKVVFQQAGVDSSVISGTDNKTAIVSEAVSAAYIKAPTSIKVTDVQISSDVEGWTATLFAGDDKCEYISYDYSSTNKDLVVDLFAATSTATKGGSDFTVKPSVIAKGVADNKATAGACYGPSNNSYVYAKFTAAAGLFQKDKLELTSASTKTATAIVGSTSLAVSTDDVKDVNATINNLVASADVYLIKAAAWNNTDCSTNASRIETAIKAFKANKTGNFVAKSPVSAGSGFTTFKGAITKVEDPTHGDLYTLVVLPENEALYAPVYTNPVITVKQVETSFKLSPIEVSSGDSRTTSKAKVDFIDQYGNSIGHTGKIIGTCNTSGDATGFASMDGVNRNTADGSLALNMNADGVITFEYVAGGGPVAPVAGDTWTFGLNTKYTIQAVAKSVNNAGEIDEITFSIVS